VTQFALGVDIGGTNTKVALVSDSGDVAGIETFPTGLDCAALIANVRDAAGRCRGGAPIRGAGVAVAGFINNTRDRLSYNPNLEWLVGFPLRDAMADALSVPVTLEVDSNASCLGEYRFGAGRGSERFLCLVAGTGLGVGMIIEGALVRFMGECVGDAGHVVVDANGPLFRKRKVARRYEMSWRAHVRATRGQWLNLRPRDARWVSQWRLSRKSFFPIESRWPADWPKPKIWCCPPPKHRFGGL